MPEEDAGPPPTDAPGSVPERATIDDSRFEPPERRGVALLSPEFLLGIIVGAATVFVGFGLFGFRAGPVNTTAVVTAAPATLLPLPTPASPTPRPTPAPTATPLPTAPPTPSPLPTPAPTATPLASLATPGVPSLLAGTWHAGVGSSAGYRVVLHLPLLGASQVHATTSSITGTLEIATVSGTDEIIAADFIGDLRQLRSGSNVLDQQVAIVLQTDRFPNSEFRLTQPVLLPAPASPGAGAALTLHGDLTLQGASRPVDLPATFTQTSTGLTLVGTTSFLLSQFGVSNVVGGFATVDDAATFEFQLVLAR